MSAVVLSAPGVVCSSGISGGIHHSEHPSLSWNGEKSIDALTELRMSNIILGNTQTQPFWFRQT
jgi:hypothetical protein